MSIEIRWYDKSDFYKLAGLLNCVYKSSIDSQQLETEYITARRNIIVAADTESSRLIGCTFVEVQDDFIRNRRILFVTYVAVDEKYRGQGIGRKLLEYAEKVCRDKGCSAIELTSANYRKQAHLFYQALNYAQKDTTVFIKEIN